MNKNLEWESPDGELLRFIRWQEINGVYWARCLVLNTEESFVYRTVHPFDIPLQYTQKLRERV